MIQDDPYLSPHAHDLEQRIKEKQKWNSLFESAENGLMNVALSYKNHGMHVDPETGDIEYREWAPAAKELSLFGDFN